MLVFLERSLAFPAVLFSLLLAFVSLYWLLVCLGLFDLEPVEIDMQAITAADRPRPGMLGATLSALGLDAVPRMVLLTLIALSGWPVSYFVQAWLIGHPLPGFFHYPQIVLAGLLALAMALLCTVLLMAVCRPVIRRIKGPPARPICGQVAVVRSPQVDRHKGQALLEDGGAGLLLQSTLR